MNLRRSEKELKFCHFTLGEIYEMTARLAEQILKSKVEVDAIVGISRGGLLPARLMSDFLGVSQLEIVRAEFYTSPGETV